MRAGEICAVAVQLSQTKASTLELPMVIVDTQALRKTIEALEEGRFEPLTWWQQHLTARTIQNNSRAQGLIALKALPGDFIPYPHQLETVHRVVEEMHGSALLADEVGLGKTIEAGLILKEYLLRGLVRRALILVPASLRFQWARELREKCGIQATVQRSEWEWSRTDLVIASLETAKREPHRSIVLEQQWDMVIVDEAHKLKNRKTQNWQFVNILPKKYMLLLTATPIQNDLNELYYLISLLRPGYLGTKRHFTSRFMAGKHEVKDAEGLRQLLDGVLIRNRRGQADLLFPKRVVHAEWVTLSSQERELYQMVTDFVRRRYRSLRSTKQNTLPLIILQREVCSSAQATAVTLLNMADRTEDAEIKGELRSMAAMAARVQQNSKIERLVPMLQKSEQQWVVFTEFRTTQELLLRRLLDAGIPAIGFHGELGRGSREWVQSLFQRRAKVLVSTQAGGEGINLQFCSHAVNFDLPWNPMRIEQRIGRLHRIGQQHDVHIINLSSVGTVEEKILYLLQEKIHLFERVIGELDAIVRQSLSESSFEGRIMELLAESEDDSAFEAKLQEIADQVENAKQQLWHPNPLDKLYSQEERST